MKFQIEIGKILEILSSRIYDSPFALLRENVQNAYDAILMRQYHDKDFEPKIDVEILADSVQVKDNGIGMTLEDLRNHFWRAGSSGKNNPQAKAAGVVGTFGIGGLANFGICKELTVISESYENNSRTKSHADRDTLSLEEDCISEENLSPHGEPGTLIVAKLLPEKKMDVENATTYLQTFVKHLPVPVYINGNLVSNRPLEDSCPPEGDSGWKDEKQNFKSGSYEWDLTFRISETGIVWVEIRNIKLNGESINGKVLLKQGMGQIMAYRSGFGLARSGVSSIYSFGGVADLDILEPTAGREALTSSSVQILQSLVSSLEKMIAPIIAISPFVDMNTSFMNWALKNNKYDLLGNLKVTLLPREQKCTLKEVADLSKEIQVKYYKGNDPTTIQAYSSDDSPLIHISRSYPRSRCEEGYLSQYSKASLVSGEPHVVQIKDENDWTTEESALAFRIGKTIESDYFISVKIQYGKITNDLPLLFSNNEKTPLLTLNPDNSGIKTLIRCYNSDFSIFNKFTKDFVRSSIFPKISHLVPSSSREGAEAFLKRLRRQTDTFEYDVTDVENLDDVIADFKSGKTTFSKAIDAALLAAKKQQQEVTANDVQTVASVMPDIIQTQKFFHKPSFIEKESPTPTFEAKPAISRTDVETLAKVLVLEESDSLFGYKGLLRLSEKAYRDRGDFFFQPHFTEIIWGGQRIIYIFNHSSGAFGFYYDIQLTELLSIPSGGARFESMCVILKNSVFLPIPSELFKYFKPVAEEKKRFEVRYDILYPE